MHAFVIPSSAQIPGPQANILIIRPEISIGIDDVRQIKTFLAAKPLKDKNIVYILQAHLLTIPAQNALLKTLEEPPNHVIFILATTEAHKIPETIASRCQTFTFRKPGLLELRQAITKVAKKEGVTIEPGAVELLALLGDGSYRDTLGVLEQVMQSAGGKKISSEAVEALFGIPGHWLILNFVLTMVNKDVAGGLSIIKKAAEQSHDLTVFLKLVLRQIRLAMLFLHAPAMRAELSANLTADEVKFLTDVAARPEAVQLPTILRELLAMYDEVGRSPLPELPLELGLLAMIKT